MFYHAKLEFNSASHSHTWSNKSKDILINVVLIPFINGQVKVVKRNGVKKVLNMKNVSYLTVYKTPHKLVKKLGATPDEMNQKDFSKYECTDEIIKEVKSSQSDIAAHSILQLAFAPPKKQVFVIMKFGDKELDSAYEGVMKPVIEAHQYKAIRIDEIQDSGKINDQILEYIATSKYVLADLSGARPNCYYEAGFAHALGKQLIFTIKKSDTVHFDLSGYRFIQWETESELRRELNKRFEGMEQEQETDS